MIKTVYQVETFFILIGVNNMLKITILCENKVIIK